MSNIVGWSAQQIDIILNQVELAQVDYFLVPVVGVELDFIDDPVLVESTLEQFHHISSALKSRRMTRNPNRGDAPSSNVRTDQ